jgi:hypothetical protein
MPPEMPNECAQINLERRAGGVAHNRLHRPVVIERSDLSVLGARVRCARSRHRDCDLYRQTENPYFTTQTTYPHVYGQL